MSTSFGKKLKEIRKAEGLTQQEFSEAVDFPKRSVVAYETEDREPNFQAMQKICAAFPHYTLYLMHDKMPVTTSDDQITPQEKALRDLPIAEKNA